MVLMNLELGNSIPSKQLTILFQSVAAELITLSDPSNSTTMSISVSSSDALEMLLASLTPNKLHTLGMDADAVLPNLRRLINQKLLFVFEHIL